MRAGKIINHYKMAKHFTLTIRDGHLEWARKEDAIKNEELLDGIYVIRTSEPAARLSAADGVRSYKRRVDSRKVFASHEIGYHVLPLTSSTYPPASRRQRVDHAGAPPIQDRTPDPLR